MTRRISRFRNSENVFALKCGNKKQVPGLSGKRFLADCRGAAAVEAAMILPVFILMMFGLMEGSRALYTTFELDYALYKTSRYAMVKTDATSSQIEAKLNQEFIILDPQNLASVSVTETLNPDKTKTAVISASYNFQFLFNMFKQSNVTFNSEQTVLRF